MEIENNHGFNFGNPELQDWDLVYKKALKNKVVLLWDREIPIAKFRKMNMGVIMKIVVPTIEQAYAKIKEFKM